MTVAQLIEALSKLPPDTKVFRDGGDHMDDWRRVQEVNVQLYYSLGKEPGAYIL